MKIFSCECNLISVQARNHLDFICSMKDYMPRTDFINRTVDAIEDEFSIRTIELEEAQSSPNTEFVHSSKILTAQELEEAS